MKISYDPAVDALSITFRETTVTTKHLGEGIAADYHAEGRLAGLEIVDAQGTVTWEGQYTPSAGAAAVPGQRAGTHFVRVYSAGGELLREYGLDVK